MSVTTSCFVNYCQFYWAHRWMHETSFYRFHKLHHEYVDCNVWATFYVTVFDMFVTDIIPAGLGPVIFNMHMYTMFIYTIPLILNASWVHVGYDQAKLFGLGFNPFLILPFATESERTHDLHHRLNNW
jgi:sterol desaturase/sphingolipid hydroxylase (fatty acid hydroxylase superfamily)